MKPVVKDMASVRWKGEKRKLKLRKQKTEMLKSAQSCATRHSSRLHFIPAQAGVEG